VQRKGECQYILDISASRAALGASGLERYAGNSEASARRKTPGLPSCQRTRFNYSERDLAADLYRWLMSGIVVSSLFRGHQYHLGGAPTEAGAG
jgi:hypothetical protein